MYALRHGMNEPIYSPSLTFPSSVGMSSVTFRDPATTLSTCTLAYPLGSGRLCSCCPSVHGQACPSATLIVVPAAGTCSEQGVNSLISLMGCLAISPTSAWLADTWLLLSTPPGLWFCGSSGASPRCCKNCLSRSWMVFCNASSCSLLTTPTASCTWASTMASNDADFLVWLRLW